MPLPLPLPYTITLIRSERKTLALCVTGPDALKVRAPKRASRAEIASFIARHEAWIQKHLAQAAENARMYAPFSAEELRAMAEQARQTLPARAAYFSRLVGVTYGRVTIRCQKTKWGSCSSLGNLNFNCLLMCCPQAVQDYVVIHELCHRKEMNHSPRFWAEVEKAMPDYKTWRAWLKKEGQALIRRCP